MLRNLLRNINFLSVFNAEHALEVVQLPKKLILTLDDTCEKLLKASCPFIHKMKCGAARHAAPVESVVQKT